MPKVPPGFTSALLRIPDPLLHRMKALVDQKRNTEDSGYSQHSFILAAIKEKCEREEAQS